MSALVTIMNVWNTEEDKECLSVDLVCTELTLIYSLGVIEENNSQNSCPQRNNLG